MTILTNKKMHVSQNKKFELMPIWDARQHQFNFVYTGCLCTSNNFGANSVFRCASQPKIMKNPLFFGFKVVQGYLMLVRPERSSAVSWHQDRRTDTITIANTR